jgi:hypothetical protein
MAPTVGKVSGFWIAVPAIWAACTNGPTSGSAPANVPPIDFAAPIAIDAKVSGLAEVVAVGEGVVVGAGELFQLIPLCEVLEVGAEFQEIAIRYI